MATSPTLSTWFLRPSRNPAAQMRLICVPYAGSGVAAYHRWTRLLDPAIEVCLLKLPGRESRIRETAYARIEPLVGAVTDALAPLLDKPYALFGHSMGALIAFELARAARQRGLRAPAHLLVSGRDAPQVPYPHAWLHRLPDDEFLARLRQRFESGIPTALWDNPDMLRHFVPTLKADFAVFETYIYRREAPLSVPLTVFNGRRDIETTPAGLNAWRAHSDRAFSLIHFDGDHFFLEPQAQPLLETIETVLLTRSLR